MYKSRIVIVFVLISYFLFVLFQFIGNESVATVFKCLILPLFTLAYFFNTERQRVLFVSLFFICFSVSDLLGISNEYISNEVRYYIGNTLYVLAYVFILLEVCISISLKYVLTNFKIHLIVLGALNLYIAYVLLLIVEPHIGLSGYIVETIYNIVMLLLLSASLLNYFYRDNTKSLYLFLGALCIVFSEVVGIASMYVSSTNLLSIITISLLLLAFFFYYFQAKYVNNDSYFIEASKK